jgi:hypothetical protein
MNKYNLALHYGYWDDKNHISLISHILDAGVCWCQLYLDSQATRQSNNGGHHP